MRLWKRLGHRALFGLSVAITLVPFVTAATSSTSTPSSPAANAQTPIRVIAGLSRRSDCDLLLLRNGQRVTGKVLNPSLELVTAYGRLTLNRRVLAGLDLHAAFQDQERVFTVNGNRFSGFLQNPDFAVQLSTDRKVQIRREAVAEVAFQLQPHEATEFPRHERILLKNGNVLTGRVLNEPLTLVTGTNDVAIRLSSAVALAALSGDSNRVQVTLRNGQTLQGDWTKPEEVRIALDLGFPIHLYRGRIRFIDDGTGVTPLPAELNGAPLTSSRPPANLAPLPPGAPLRDELVPIPAGTFTMGSPPDESGRDLDEGPLTVVTLSKPFWMGKYEVTQGQYEAVMGTNPSLFTGDPQRPVERVSWLEAMDYCTRLTRRAQIAATLPTGYVYRLPTEAEWEYACRAGTHTRFSYGNDPGCVQLDQYAWFMEDGDSTTHPVGRKKPNPWGLYDMHGNVWEWCLDRWNGSYPGGKVTDYTGPSQGSLRVARGGSWLYEGKFCRSANRDDYAPRDRCSDVGFRVVLAPAVAGFGF